MSEADQEFFCATPTGERFGLTIESSEPYRCVVCPECYAQRDLNVPVSSITTWAGVGLHLPSGERLKIADRDQEIEFCLVCRWHQVKV